MTIVAFWISTLLPEFWITVDRPAEPVNAPSLMVFVPVCTLVAVLLATTPFNCASLMTPSPPRLEASAAAGIGFVGAYGLVLLALTRSAAAPVAAVRETSVVILTIMSAFWLRETISRRQWLAVVVIVIGIATLALG